MQKSSPAPTAFELIYVEREAVACDGGGGPLGHPRVSLHIESETGETVCPYCSRTYRLKPGYIQLGH